MAQLSTLQEARNVIASRAKDPKAKMFGLSSDLLVIGRALDELESRTDTLAAALVEFVAQTFGQAHSADFSDLRDFGPKTERAVRVIQHGERCTCHQCM